MREWVSLDEENGWLSGGCSGLIETMATVPFCERASEAHAFVESVYADALDGTPPGQRVSQPVSAFSCDGGERVLTATNPEEVLRFVIDELEQGSTRTRFDSDDCSARAQRFFFFTDNVEAIVEWTGEAWLIRFVDAPCD